MPLHHVAVYVSDIKKSREFYDPVLAACGYVVSFAFGMSFALDPMFVIVCCWMFSGWVDGWMKNTDKPR
jgi:sugar phosphate permease